MPDEIKDPEALSFDELRGHVEGIRNRLNTLRQRLSRYFVQKQELGALADRNVDLQAVGAGLVRSQNEPPVLIEHGA